MVQVMRWGALLGAIIVLGLNGALGVIRNAQPTQGIILKHGATENLLLGVQYSLLIPGVNRLIPIITSESDIYYLGRHTQWLYFAEFVPQTTFMMPAFRLFRVHPNGREREAIEHLVFYWQISDMQSLQWLFYWKYNAAGGYDLYRLSLADPTPVNLTAAVPLSIANVSGSIPQVYSNGEWVFIKTAASTGVPEIHRVRIDGTDLTKLGLNLPFGVSLQYLSPDGLWLLGFSVGQPIMLAGDGSQFVPLLQNRMAVNETYAEFTFLLQRGITIITGFPTSYAVRLDNREQLWSNPTISRVLTTDPAEEWIYYRDANAQLTRMRWDGTGAQALAPSYIVDIGWGWTADGQWYLFPAYNRNTSTLEVLRLHRDGQTLETLAEMHAAPSAAQWSPDGEWIYFWDQQVGRGFWDLFRMRGDGTLYRNLTLPFAPSQYRYEGEIPFEGQKRHSASLALSAATLLGISFGLGRWRDRAKKGRPEK